MRKKAATVRRIPAPLLAQGRSVDRFLQSQGIGLRFRDEGAGPALVLIHGWALDLDMWAPQIETLARTHRVIRMDRRGFGLSGGVPDLDADALDLARLLDFLNVEHATVLGMSQGARVAIALARLEPARVQALVLDGAPAMGLDSESIGEAEVPVAHYRRVLEREGREALRRELAAHPFMRLWTADDSMHRLLDTLLARYPATDLAEGLPSQAASAALPRLDVPVLVVNGEHDTGQRRAAGDALAAAFPRAQRALIARAGHFPNLDNPTAYGAVLCEFLERHTARGR